MFVIRSLDICIRKKFWSSSFSWAPWNDVSDQQQEVRNRILFTVIIKIHYASTSLYFQPMILLTFKISIAFTVHKSVSCSWLPRHAIFITVFTRVRFLLCFICHLIPRGSPILQMLNWYCTVYDFRRFVCTYVGCWSII